MHTPQWITFPTHSCHVLYFCGASMLLSFIMWLIVSSLSTNNLHLVFCCVLLLLLLLLFAYKLNWLLNSFFHLEKMFIHSFIHFLRQSLPQGLVSKVSRLINLNPIRASCQKIIQVKSDVSAASGNKKIIATSTRSFVNIVRKFSFLYLVWFSIYRTTGFLTTTLNSFKINTTTF